MVRKTEYEKGWYDCYKVVRSLMSGAMKEMVLHRAPQSTEEDVKGTENVVSRPARGNGAGKRRARMSASDSL